MSAAVKKEKHDDHDHGHGASHDKTPSTETKVEKAPAMGVIVIIVVAVVLWGLFSYFSRPAADPERTTATSSSHEMALVLRYECITPCSADIQWPMQIWGDGPDFWVRFKGIEDKVRFGRGKFSAPSGFEAGETFFEAVDQNQPVVIRVYEVR